MVIEPGFGNVVPTHGAAALGSLGHGLLLERGHAAEAADGSLIQRNCFLAFFAKGIFPIKRAEIGPKTRSVDFNLGR